MATEVIKIVDPDNGSGTNYTSLSAWEAGEQGDLTGARDEIAVAKCRCTGGTADTTAVTIEGWTTSATQYIKIWTDPSESYRHNGTYQTGNKYRLEVSNSTAIDFNEYHLRIIGLQIRITSVNAHDQVCIRNWNTGWPSSGAIYISHNVIRGTNSQYVYHEGIGLWDQSSTGGSSLKFFIYNNTVYGFTPVAGAPWKLWASGIDFDANSGSSLAYMYNNTVAYCGNGCIDYGGSHVKIINNIAYQCDVPFFTNGSWLSGTGYNATDGSTATGQSSDRTSQTFSFVDADNRDFHLQSTDTGAKGYGTNLSSDSDLPFSDDIDGQDRGGSGATWDIGADEYVAAYPYYAYAQQ